MGKRRKVQILDWFFCFIPIEERKDIYDYYFVEVLCLIHEEACINIRANRDDRRALAYTIREVGINTNIESISHKSTTKNHIKSI